MAKGAFDWADYFAGHVGAHGNFFGGDSDLQTFAVGVGDGGTEDYAVETGPQGIGHTHGARFATGVKHTTR